MIYDFYILFTILNILAYAYGGGRWLPAPVLEIHYKLALFLASPESALHPICVLNILNCVVFY